jgi:ribosomal protein S18 acetylase RimI-like enzyme
LEYRTITPEDLEDVLELQNMVYEDLENKEVLETIEAEEFSEMIEQGFIIGMFKGDDLKAVRAMYIPPVDDPEHLAADGGVEQREEVIYSEITFIHPDERGQGLQTKLGRELIKKVKDDGRFNYVFTTVMPTNLPSLKDKLRLGFKIVNTRYMYGGKLRHVMQLNLRHPLEGTGEPKKVNYNDTGWMLEHGRDHIGDNLEDSQIDYYLKDGSIDEY